MFVCMRPSAHKHHIVLACICISCFLLYHTSTSVLSTFRSLADRSSVDLDFGRIPQHERGLYHLRSIYTSLPQLSKSFSLLHLARINLTHQEPIDHFLMTFRLHSSLCVSASSKSSCCSGLLSLSASYLDQEGW